MTPRIRRFGVAAAAATCAVAGTVALVQAAGAPDAPDRQATPAAPPTSLSAATTEAPAAATTAPAFADGTDARDAAEELIATYIQSQYVVTVSDVACSTPDSGDVGAEFTCYALKPGQLIIALRATVSDDRLIELELLFDQSEPTTTVAASDTTAPSG